MCVCVCPNLQFWARFSIFIKLGTHITQLDDTPKLLKFLTITNATMTHCKILTQEDTSVTFMSETICTAVDLCYGNIFAEYKIKI
jgi:hypothetical protein